MLVSLSSKWKLMTLNHITEQTDVLIFHYWPKFLEILILNVIIKFKNNIQLLIQIIMYYKSYSPTYIPAKLRYLDLIQLVLS